MRFDYFPIISNTHCAVFLLQFIEYSERIHIITIHYIIYTILLAKFQVFSIQCHL